MLFVKHNLCKAGINISSYSLIYYMVYHLTNYITDPYNVYIPSLNFKVSNTYIFLKRVINDNIV